MIVPKKYCTGCGNTFPHTKEYFHNAGKGRLVSQCKACKRKVASAYYYANREAQLKKNAHYRDEHREEMRAYFRAYNAENREKRQAYSREYYWKDVEQSRSRGRKHYEANKSSYVERAVKWAAANPEKAQAHQRNKRMQRRNAPLDGDARAYVEIICKDPCAYCGESPEPFEIDHITPISAGGKSDWENLAPACRTCNAAKGGKDLLTFLLRSNEGRGAA